ncbi:PspC domain-containing protein [Propionibacterium sp.]|uniref:PspC domain-containing protein n=1 Tax=Propionibacterium sp. TaxID=1977903 RepID=UPI0039EC20B8
MSEKKLVRSRDHRMIAGVAGGIGEYLGVDPNIVRLVFIILALITFGTAVVLYLAGWLLLPDQDDGSRGFDSLMHAFRNFKRGGNGSEDTFDPYSEK